MSISKKLEQIIIGGLLGDFCIENRNGRASSILKVRHGPKQENYIKWKYSFFEKEGLVTEKGVYFRIAKHKTRKEYPGYDFYTKSLPIFTYYYNLFYINGIKKVSREILDKLEPLGLAIWFMDDGSRAISYKISKKFGYKYPRSRRLRIATESFLLEGNEIIRDYFKDKWDINVNINKHGKYYHISMGANNAKKFIPLIESYMLPELKYKIDLEYNVTHPIKDEDVLCSK